MLVNIHSVKIWLYFGLSTKDDEYHSVLYFFHRDRTFNDLKSPLKNKYSLPSDTVNASGLIGF